MSSELIRVSALAPLLPLAAASPESVERQVVAVLVQLILIILAARLFAIGFRKMGQPAVVGEILAGLILGPSIFKHVPALTPVWRSIFEPTDPSPEIARALASVPAVFGALSQLGLIFLLFLIGLEFDFSHLKTNNRSAIAISTMGVMAPFGLGYGLAAIMHRSLALAAQGIEFHGFALFMGTAMSITAIPILGRIMMELNITRSRLGRDHHHGGRHRRRDGVDPARDGQRDRQNALSAVANAEDVAPVHRVRGAHGLGRAPRLEVLGTPLDPFRADEPERAGDALCIDFPVRDRDEPDRHLRHLRRLHSRGGALG